jgi:hypothetical protein
MVNFPSLRLAVIPVGVEVGIIFAGFYKYILSWLILYTETLKIAIKQDD